MDGMVKLLDFLLLVISQILHQIKLLKMLLLNFWVIWNGRTSLDVVAGHSTDIVIRMPPSVLEIHSTLNGENIKIGTNAVKRIKQLAENLYKLITYKFIKQYLPNFLQ